MPSPVAHSLMGYLITRAEGQTDQSGRWGRLVLYIAVANAADLDFIPGFVIGDPNRFHHGISHSIGFAVLFALLCGISWALLKRESIGKHVMLFFCLYTSHLGLDYLSLDTKAPYGLPILWPLSDVFYIAPFAFLLDIQRSASSLDFVPSLFSLHNAIAMSIELIILSLLIVLESLFTKNLLYVIKKPRVILFHQNDTRA